MGLIIENPCVTDYIRLSDLSKLIDRFSPAFVETYNVAFIMQVDYRHIHLVKYTRMFHICLCGACFSAFEKKGMKITLNPYTPLRLGVAFQCIFLRWGYKSSVHQFLRKQKFLSRKIPVTFFEFPSYLTGVITADMRWHLSNMNVIFNSYHVFRDVEKLRK